MKVYVLVNGSERRYEGDETLEIISECSSKKEAKEELEYFKNRPYNNPLQRFEVEIWENGKFLSILT